MLYPFERLLTKFAESISPSDMLSNGNLDSREITVSAISTHPVAGKCLAVLIAAGMIDGIPGIRLIRVNGFGVIFRPRFWDQMPLKRTKPTVVVQNLEC
jgi:hypothetical protein